ncbi:unnamed protein product, partial [Lampetra fluviatilis]
VGLLPASSRGRPRVHRRRLPAAPPPPMLPELPGDGAHYRGLPGGARGHHHPHLGPDAAARRSHGPPV